MKLLRLLALCFVFAAIGGGTVAASAETADENEHTLYVLVGREEGQEMLVYCVDGEVVVTIGMYADGGAYVSVAPLGYSCDLDVLLEQYPGAKLGTFDDHPDESWTVETDRFTGSMEASRCDEQGLLFTLTTGQMREFTVTPGQPSSDCSGSVA